MRRLFLAALLCAMPGTLFAQASPSAYTSATRYDAMNRVTGTIAPDPDGAGGNAFPAVRNSYDAAGRLVRVETGTLSAWQSETVAPASWTGFTVYLTVETSYDAMGRKTREVTSTSGTVQRVSQYGYDAVGRLECTATRMNPGIFPNAAGTGGSLPSSACALGTQGSHGPDRITRIVYDAAGQRVQLRAGVGTAIEAAEATWAYDLNGQITTMIDAEGNRAALRYDGHGRQDRWTFPSTTGPSAYNDATQATVLASAGSVNAADYEGFGYDPNGNRTSLRKRDDSTIAYSYDALNRVTVKSVTPASARTGTPQALTSAQVRPVHYAYDLRGLQTEARFDSLSGEGITNHYDGFGRLAQSDNSMGGTARSLYHWYDRDGNRTRTRHPDSPTIVQFDYAYDGLDRPTSLTDAAQALTHLYEPWGTVSGIIRIGGASGRWTTPDGRLISLSHYDGPSFTLDTYWAFAHNPAGQIAIQWGMNDAYAWTGHYAVQRPYATNGLNQYNQTGSGAGTAAFTYDANGNLVTQTVQSVTQTWVYDIENRLVGAPGSVVLTYDPLGRLYAVSSPSTDTRFLHDGDALVGEYNAAGTLLRRYVHDIGADVPAIQYEGTTVSATTRRYLLANAQGSIVASTDGSSVIQSRNTYDEYGIPGAGNSGRFQYTGQIWLPELGMYHYKARVYSPTLGRFLQTDPIGYDDQFNLYAYVGNDPVSAVDPSGRQTEIQMLGYPLNIPFISPQGHTFIWYRDVRTGETRIARGGPNGNFLFGSSSATTTSHRNPEGDGTQLVGIDTPERNSPDRGVAGTILLDRTVVPDSFSEVRSRISSFTEQVNDADIGYSPLSDNSNRFAGDVFSILTGREPRNDSPIGFPGLSGNLFPRPPPAPPPPCLPVKDWTGCR